MHAVFREVHHRLDDRDLYICLFTGIQATIHRTQGIWLPSTIQGKRTELEAQYCLTTDPELALFFQCNIKILIIHSSLFATG